MQRLKHARLLVCVAFLVIAVLPAVVGAHTTYTYYYNDYSYVEGQHLAAGVCDNTTDGHPAYNNFYVWNSGTNPYRVDDTNGSQYGCGQTGSYWSGIQKHHVCRGQPGSDPCAPYLTVT